MVNPISFGPSGINSQADFSPLANLGTIYQKAQQDQANKAAFAAFQQTGDPRALIGSGDMNLARLGTELARNKVSDSRDARDFQFRQTEAQRAQQNADRSYGVQVRTADRLEDDTPKGYRKEGDRVVPIPGGPEDPQQQARTEEAQRETRRQAVIKAGRDPEHPTYQSFILTGKMPREDAQPLTATDKKAILDADEHVQTNQAAIDSLKRAKALSSKAYSGWGAGVRGVVGSQAGLEGAQATEQLENEITSNALGQLKAIFGGAPTEGERKILLDIQGSTGKPDAVRQGIYDRAQKAAEKRLEFNRQRADALRGGSFYKPQGGKPTPQTDVAPPPDPLGIR
jgi:hypothetical protein